MKAKIFLSELWQIYWVKITSAINRLLQAQARNVYNIFTLAYSEKLIKFFKFPYHHLYLRPDCGLLEFLTVFRLWQIRQIRLPDQREILTNCLASFTQYLNIMDGQTIRRTELLYQHFALHNIVCNKTWPNCSSRKEFLRKISKLLV